MTFNTVQEWLSSAPKDIRLWLCNGGFSRLLDEQITAGEDLKKNPSYPGDQFADWVRNEWRIASEIKFFLRNH